MLRLRTGIIVLALWFFLLYNLERLEPINIASFVYILVPVAIGFILMAPRLFRGVRVMFLVTPILILYFVLKSLLNYPIAGSMSLPITITEIASLMVSILLAHQLAYIVTDFEDTVAKLTFRQIGLPPRLFESIDQEDLYREVKRCRRFQHPLVLMLVEPAVAPSGEHLNRVLEELQETIASRFLQARLAKLLSEELRDIDLIAQHGNGFAILLPETTREDAEKLINDMRHDAITRLGTDLKVGIGSFPDTALTLGGLLDTAAEELQVPKSDEKPALSSSAAD